MGRPCEYERHPGCGKGSSRYKCFRGCQEALTSFLSRTTEVEQDTPSRGLLGGGDLDEAKVERGGVRCRVIERDLDGGALDGQCGVEFTLLAVAPFDVVLRKRICAG